MNMLKIIEKDSKSKYIVLNDERKDMYQLEGLLPFTFKSTWRKSKRIPWGDYYTERLEAQLVQKHKSILKRDFKQHQYKSIFEKITEEKYCKCKSFFYHANVYEKINGKTIENIDKEIDEELKCIEKEEKFEYERYKNNQSVLSFSKLKELMRSAKCSYCGITIEQINKLSEKKRLNTKRARGYSIEIDQKDSCKGYTDDNCVASCYWCNNAKTDEFTVNEFKEIARGINLAWQKRLGDEKVVFPEESAIWINKDSQKF